MEMTLSRLGLDNVKSLLSGFVMPIGILVLVAMMVLPLPVYLLDTFFVSNILLSLLILMVAMHTHRPLEFSSFPTLLLIATVLRLGLNVASTRIILSNGHEGSAAAGRVIEAFGQFVIAGNFAVGMFVFVILVIINLLKEMKMNPNQVINLKKLINVHFVIKVIAMLQVYQDIK